MRCSVLAAALACVAAVAAQEPVSVDDTDPSIVYYTPSGRWTYHTLQAESFKLYNASDTFTSTQGATITWKFRGTHIEYWGNTGSYHGPCRVELDGGNVQTITSNAAQTGPPQNLYQRSGLDPNVEHTIVITVVADSFPNVCEIDRFVYIPVDTETPTSTTTSTRPSGSSGSSSNGGGSGNNSSASSSSTPPWGIIGGAIGGAVGGGVIIAVLLYWYCRRRKNRKDLEEIIEQQPTIPIISSSQPQSPFPPRPVSHDPSVLSNKAQMAASTRPPSTAYTASVYPTSAATTDGLFHPQSLMPVAHPDMSSRHTSTYGSEASYGVPTSPTHSSHSSRPLMLHNPTQSSLGSANSTGAGAANLPHSLAASGRRPTMVLSAATELGEGESLGLDEKRRPLDPVPVPPVAAVGPGPSSPTAQVNEQKKAVLSAETQAPGAASSGATGSGASSSARPLVQHMDGGTAPAPAPATDGPEELPPAYNEQWQSGQRR